MSGCSVDTVVEVGKLAVSLKWKAALVGDRPLHLGPQQYQLLELLCLKKGGVVTNGELTACFLGKSAEMNLLTVSISKLRAKIAKATGGESYIQTVRGEGYILKDPADYE